MRDLGEELDRLVADAVAVPLSGWDFSALDGRTVSEPLPWDYLALARAAAGRARRVLDVDTGGGEVLVAVGPPRGSVAVEPYAPNVGVAAAALAPYGVEVRPRTGARLPVEDGAVDLVLNRHGALDPAEAFRVLEPGGLLLTQQVGRDNEREINDALGVPPADVGGLASARTARALLGAAGFEVLRSEEARPRTRYLDVGALVLQLRAVAWQVPGFDPVRHRDGLRRVHAQVVRDGGFAVTGHRLLLLARRPDRARAGRGELRG